MSRLLVAGVLIGLCGAQADAEPQMRFGMTFGVNRNIPEAQEFGPMFGVGASSGRFTGELNYAYLSMFDDVARVHRAGVSLRMDIARRWGMHRESSAWYGELGAAKRFGFWSPDDIAPAVDKSQSELQVAAGYELSGNGGAWQVALRFGFARRDPMLGSSCRGVGCPLAMPAASGVAESVMLEWTWLLGRRY
ncbi:MAG TPA: hypothetical protein VIV40_29430 [Kofleriaceae bacterium]